MAAEEAMSGCLVDVRVDSSCLEQGPMLTHDLNREGGLSRSLRRSADQVSAEGFGGPPQLRGRRNASRARQAADATFVRLSTGLTAEGAEIAEKNMLCLLSGLRG
jgi:hypothetical protein